MNEVNCSESGAAQRSVLDRFVMLCSHELCGQIGINNYELQRESISEINKIYGKMPVHFGSFSDFLKKENESEYRLMIARLINNRA